MKLFVFTLLVTLFSSTAFASDLNRKVRVVNVSNKTVTHLYGSNSYEDSWQEDILDMGVLPSRSSIVINFFDGTNHCLFDIKVIFSDGDVSYKSKFNVCKESELFIFD
jgi:hypothetical protein